MKCRKCKALAVKNGKQTNGRQRYYCKACSYSFQISYQYNAYNDKLNKKIYLLLKESVGIRGTARLLNVSKTTVIKRIKYMGSLIEIPITNEKPLLARVSTTASASL